MSPWSSGRTYLNFAGVEDTALDSVRRAYGAEDFARLQVLKAIYDPDNVFRVNFNILPKVDRFASLHEKVV
jgi:FAD/FMN-containing dehydrogenase